jgi:hypothetical protein
MGLSTDLSASEVAIESRRLQCDVLEIIRGGFNTLAIEYKAFELYLLFRYDVVRALHGQHRHPWNPTQVTKTVKVFTDKWVDLIGTFHKDEGKLQNLITNAAKNSSIFTPGEMTWATEKLMIGIHVLHERDINSRAPIIDSIKALQSASSKFANEPMSRDKARYQLLPIVAAPLEGGLLNPIDGKKDPPTNGMLYLTQYSIIDDVLAQHLTDTITRDEFAKMKETVATLARDWIERVSSFAHASAAVRSCVARCTCDRRLLAYM